MSGPSGRLHLVTARADLLGERIARHGLGSRTASSPPAAAALTTALQAQDNQAARLGVRARSADVTEADVVAAIESTRTITRTWLMRGTIHLVATADLRWLVRLLGPAVGRKMRTRWRQLGLTDDVLARSVAALPDLLAGGPLTRREIRAGLATRGLDLDRDDPAASAHAIVHASTCGLLCRGPNRGRDSTFALLDQWVPDAPEGPSGHDALAELARRYFAAFSPATAADFTAWSGLPSARAVAAIRDELIPADVDGRPGFRLGEVAPARGVRLLPAFDNYLLGYRDRNAIVAPEHQAQVYRGGMISPVVLRDGRAVGTWALARATGRVTVTPFAPLGREVRRAIRAEVADLGRFLGRELRCEPARGSGPAA